MRGELFICLSVFYTTLYQYMYVLLQNVIIDCKTCEFKHENEMQNNFVRGTVWKSSGRTSAASMH